MPGGSNMHSFIEIFKDFMFLSSTLEFKKKLNNLNSKNIFSGILMSMAPIVIDEFITFLDKNQLIHRSKFFTTKQSSDLVRNLRNQSLKIRSSESSKVEESIKLMGINFEEYIYDIRITVDEKHELLDINFENVVLNQENDLPTYESLFSIMNTALQSFFSSVDFNYNGHLKNQDLNEFYLNKAQLFEEDYKLEDFSYSTNLLFISSLSEQLTIKDKSFILFNYRTIYSCSIIPMPISSYITVGSIEIDPNETLYKYIAINIEKIGQELLKMKTYFSEKLLEEIDANIEDKRFYSLNRKLRNNLHYSNIDIISTEDMNVIKKYQKNYVETLLSIINSYINISLSEEVKNITLYTNLALKEGLSFKELSRNHEDYYSSFLKTGSIINKNDK